MVEITENRQEFIDHLGQSFSDSKKKKEKKRISPSSGNLMKKVHKVYMPLCVILKMMSL